VFDGVNVIYLVKTETLLRPNSVHGSTAPPFYDRRTFSH